MIFSFLRNTVLQTPTYLTIVAGLVLVGYQQWVGPLPVSTQVIFCAGLLLVAGIPHGALDHLIERERSFQQGVPFSMLRFMAKYLLLIAIYGIGWLLFPVGSLVVFLLISAWHFGETDLEKAPNTLAWSMARFIAGGFVLALILLTHTTETTPILSRIVQNDPSSLQLWLGAVSHAREVLMSWAALTVVLALVAFWQVPIPINGWRLARLGMVLVLSCPLPLLPAFMLYFGGWHALSSFGAIRSYLHLPTFSLQSIWQIWLQSIPLTSIAFVFLSICSVIWYNFSPQFDPLPTLFILISTITLPHIQVMHGLHAYGKKQ